MRDTSPRSLVWSALAFYQFYRKTHSQIPFSENLRVFPECTSGMPWSTAESWPCLSRRCRTGPKGSTRHSKCGFCAYSQTQGRDMEKPRQPRGIQQAAESSDRALLPWDPPPATQRPPGQVSRPRRILSFDSPRGPSSERTTDHSHVSISEPGLFRDDLNHSRSLFIRPFLTFTYDTR